MATEPYAVGVTSFCYRSDIATTRESLPPSFSVPESTDADPVQCDFSAFQASKRGENVEVAAAEYLALRLQREVDARAACQCCHACGERLPAAAKQSHCIPDNDTETGPVIPHHMDKKRAIAKIKLSGGTCLLQEALMAMATGKKGSVICALQGQSIGRRLQV
jgi:hypothetical protein